MRDDPLFRKYNPFTISSEKYIKSILSYLATELFSARMHALATLKMRMIKQNPIMSNLWFLSSFLLDLLKPISIQMNVGIKSIALFLLVFFKESIPSLQPDQALCSEPRFLPLLREPTPSTDS